MIDIRDTSKRISHLKSMAESNLEDPINKTIQQIVNYIKYEQDYNSAINLISENNLTLEELIKRTSRIRNDELFKLTNLIISQR